VYYIVKNFDYHPSEDQEIMDKPAMVMEGKGVQAGERKD
jgi:hypothetical protein